MSALYFSVRQLSQASGRTTGTITKHISRGWLPAEKIVGARGWRIRHDKAKRWLMVYHPRVPLNALEALTAQTGQEKSPEEGNPLPPQESATLFQELAYHLQEAAKRFALLGEMEPLDKATVVER